MAIGGAQSLGTARGSIQIDTSDLRNVAGVVRSVATDVSRQMGAIDTATKRTQSQFMALSRGIGQIKGELTGLALGAGALSGLGLRVAASFEEADIKLSGMTGSIENAQKLTAELRKQAAAAGLPFQDMLNMATRLLPTLGGNTKELEQWYDIVKRTAVLNAQEGITGAAFSINEALSSGGTDLVSLVERFNISRVKLKAALAANDNDFRAALDEVLNQMGITTEVADRMGQSFNASFRVAKDAALQLLAEGFTPLLQILTPILQKTALWLAQLRETNPAIAQMGAGLATVTALGAPTLLLFNQLVEAGQKLKALGILGGLGKAGVVGLAAGAAVGLNTAGNRLIGSMTGNEKQANTSLADSFTYFKNGLAVLTKWLIDGAMYVNQGLIKLTQSFLAAAGAINSAAGNLLRYIGNVLPSAMGGTALTQAGEFLTKTGAASQQANAELDKRLVRMWQGAATMKQGVQTFFMGSGPGATGDSGAFGGGPGGSAGAGNTERNKIISQWAKDAARIEREAGQARLDEERSYGDQRDETIRQYNLSALRDAEDFQRSRSRAVTAHNRQVDEAIADAAERDADWQKDYNEKITEIRQDGNEQVADLERNYAKDRERRERDHRDRLLNAAARLDAVAVAEEQRSYARQQADAEENFSEQRTKLQDALAERLADELEAHQERLTAAHEADARRLEDMRRSFEEQIAEQDLERAIQQQRRAEDFASQLAKMDAAHAERLAQIDQQAAQERAALNESFIAQLNDLGIYNKAWRDQQAAAQAESLRLFGEFWKQFNASMPGATQGPQAPYPGNVGQFPSSFADYGFGMQRAASGGSVSNRSITISEGAIQIYPSVGMDERAVARQVRTEMERLLVEAAR